MDPELVQNSDLFDEAGKVGRVFESFAATFDDEKFASVMFEIGQGVA